LGIRLLGSTSYLLCILKKSNHEKNIEPIQFLIEPPVSICPAGEHFPLPRQDDDAAEFIRSRNSLTSSGRWAG